MPAYAVFIRNSIKDQDGFDAYGAAARAARGDHKLEPIVFYNPSETVEGEPADAVAIIKFESMDAARAWYHSPAYQEAAKLRQASADYRVILTEGL